MDTTNFKEIIDLSVPLKSLDTPIFPVYPQPLKTDFTTIRDNGFSSNVWTFADHSSTHVDSPAHFSSGNLTIDQMPIRNYVAKGLVLDFTHKKPKSSITEQELKAKLEANSSIGPGWALLFYTGYTAKSRTPEWMDYPGLDEEAAKFLVERGVNAVGFDAPAPDHDPSPAHRTLLPNRISIYENLNNLNLLLDKQFIFVGAPLMLVGGSASPVRALAIIL